MDVLISRDRIQARVIALGQEIAAQLPGDDVVLVGPLKGCVVFCADLARALHDAGVAVEMDFLELSSYGAGTESSGVITMKKDLSDSIAGRDVLLVDDIIDTGRTLHWAREHLLAKEPASLRIAAFLDKPSRRTHEVPVDHVGFEVPDLFVLGYGADLAQRFRELPYIGVKTD